MALILQVVTSASIVKWQAATGRVGGCSGGTKNLLYWGLEDAAAIEGNWNG
jgi:hypothetical protein